MCIYLSFDLNLQGDTLHTFSCWSFWRLKAVSLSIRLVERKVSNTYFGSVCRCLHILIDCLICMLKHTIWVDLIIKGNNDCLKVRN